MTSAIIVAAGKGTRMGPNVDKLFLEAAGRPVVAHTWARFNAAACIDEIIVVVRDTMQGAFTELADKFQLRKPYRLVVGGNERLDSVWNGLLVVAPGTEIVAIQDGARPCTSEKLIAETILAARRCVLLATGGAKAGVVARAIQPPPSSALPASALQLHADATFILDAAAASQLA